VVNSHIKGDKIKEKSRKIGTITLVTFPSIQFFAEGMQGVAQRPKPIDDFQILPIMRLSPTNDCRKTSGADDLPAGATGKQEKSEINKQN